jgi:hypothetical protein
MERFSRAAFGPPFTQWPVVTGALRGRCIMSNAMYRAERCRDLSEEYRRVAALCASIEIRNHYLRMVDHYRTLALRPSSWNH